MKKRGHIGSLSRRQFLGEGVRSAGLLGGAALTARLAGPFDAAAAGRNSNPFAYDVGGFTKTDPALIHYEEIRRFASPRPEPRRLASGPDGRLYLAAGHYVCVMDLQGVVGASLALPEPVRCLAVAEDGSLYVGLKGHLEVFDRNGQPREVWESPGERTWFTGLAVGANDVFAADAGNRIVRRYDRSGKPAGRIGAKDPERNILGFVVPSPFFDLKLHPDGLLRVANPGRHRVEAYTFNGDLEFAWGKPSAAIDGFCGCCNPVNFALLPDGRFVTCEKGLPRVKVYSRDGEFESVVAGPEVFPANARATGCERSFNCSLGGLDAAADSQGRIYVLDLVEANIRVMARKGASAPKSAASSS